jgi:hypothetical protein
MSLPITQKQAYTVAEWMKSNFGPAIDKAVKGTPFSIDILCGIACQETAYFWLPLLKRLSAKEILAGVCLMRTATIREQNGAHFPGIRLRSENNMATNSRIC